MKLNGNSNWFVNNGILKQEKGIFISLLGPMDFGCRGGEGGEKILLVSFFSLKNFKQESQARNCSSSFRIPLQ